VTFESGISKAQGGQNGSDGGASLSIAMGANASGRLFREATESKFNPTKESPMQLEAADLPNINKKTVFSNQTAESTAQQPHDNKDVGKMLGAAAIAGNIVKSDTNYSPAAVMAADARIGISKKTNAA
jgi:hypothetical protein